jgi:allantoicase
MSVNLDDYIDLASEKLGGAAILANDEFFAPKELLVAASAPVWKEGLYTERGKWMDGWETRRRRSPGYDWCIVRLGLPGSLRALVVDTAFFRGNYPESCSVDACVIDSSLDLAEVERADWFELLPQSKLQGDSRNIFELNSDRRVTHLRLNIFPDGGVARLRAHGMVQPNWEKLSLRGELDLAAAENGGVVLACSDMFFGHRHNLIMPGRAPNMGDGWETKRRRGPGHDWTVIQLGRRGRVKRVEVDTTHYKGNAPGSCMLELVDVNGELRIDSAKWTTALPQTPLQPHTRHVFEVNAPAATHARFSIFPDGGIGRLRLYGALEDR